MFEIQKGVKSDCTTNINLAVAHGGVLLTAETFLTHLSLLVTVLSYPPLSINAG